MTARTMRARDGDGDRVGQYVLRREIGKGAMATVYEAEHVVLGKRVALKWMHPHLATDATAASRFLLEGRAATQIRSPHVVAVFDVGEHGGIPYLVMELLDGVDLAALLHQKKRLATNEVADLMIPVASAVHAAHRAGVIHRDLKPSNIMLARKDGGGVAPVILDFGISKLTGEIDRDLTASEVLLGTVHYMSPEQTQGGKRATAASDQYAIGVMLYECLTGTKPFAGRTPYAVMHAIVSAAVSPPSSLDPALPTALDEVVLRAMNRDPGARFPSVQALGMAVLPWASEEIRERYRGEFGVAAPGSFVGKTRRPYRRLALVGLGATVTLGIAASVLRMHGPKTASAPHPEATPAELTPIGSTAVLPPEDRAMTGGLQSAEIVRATQPRAVFTARPTLRGATITSPRLASPSSARPERGTNGALIVE
jgi:tRNA A-37 threonylcarbamoyl transferase component Bud32